MSEITPTGFDTRDLERPPSPEDRAALRTRASAGEFGAAAGGMDALRLGLCGFALVVTLLFVLGGAQMMTSPFSSFWHTLPMMMLFAVPMLGIIAWQAVGPARRVLRDRQAWQPLALFAARNGLRYTHEAPNRGIPGALLHRPGSRLVQVLSSDDGHSAVRRAAAMEWTEGDDDNEHLVRRNIVALRFDATVPHVVLDSLTNGPVETEAGHGFHPRTRVPLEGGADRLYRLHAPDGRAADALQLFTLDVVQELVDHPLPCDLELVDGWAILSGGSELDAARPETWRLVEHVQREVLPRLARPAGRYVDRGPSVPAERPPRPVTAGGPSTPSRPLPAPREQSERVPEPVATSLSTKGKVLVAVTVGSILLTWVFLVWIWSSMR